MTDPIYLRRRVRFILSTLPAERRLSEDILFDKLRPDFPELKVDEMKRALTWNLEQNYADFRYNKDLERNEWFLTPGGRHKEGIA